MINMPGTYFPTSVTTISTDLLAGGSVTIRSKFHVTGAQNRATFHTEVVTISPNGQRYENLIKTHDCLAYERKAGADKKHADKVRKVVGPLLWTLFVLDDTFDHVVEIISSAEGIVRAETVRRNQIARYTQMVRSIPGAISTPLEKGFPEVAAKNVVRCRSNVASFIALGPDDTTAKVLSDLMSALDGEVTAEMAVTTSEIISRLP